MFEILNVFNLNVRKYRSAYAGFMKSAEVSQPTWWRCLVPVLDSRTIILVWDRWRKHSHQTLTDPCKVNEPINSRVVTPVRTCQTGNQHVASEKSALRLAEQHAGPVLPLPSMMHYLGNITQNMSHYSPVSFIRVPITRYSGAKCYCACPLTCDGGQMFVYRLARSSFDVFFVTSSSKEKCFLLKFTLQTVMKSHCNVE